MLSAGTLRSPGILMQSGVGDCDYLKTKNIDCVHNLKGVGKNLQYHVISPILAAFLQGFDLNQDVFAILFDGKWTLNGLTSPKHLIETFYFKKRPYFGSAAVALGYIQCHHRSRGQVYLKSNNASEIPQFQLNAFQHPDDIKDHIEGFRLTMNVVKTMAKNVSVIQVSPQTSEMSDEDIFTYVKNNLILFHLTGTARMGKSTNPYAVVDTKLRVRGINGLRVGDLSVIPDVPTGIRKYNI